jgi:glycosyltransferase involved in cell wall biosynthesis
MRVLLYTSWGNRWKESTSKAFESLGWETEWCSGEGKTQVPDIIFSMWANEFVINCQEHLPRVPIFTYIRHYEVFTDLPRFINWDKIKGVFFCAKHVQDIANAKWPGLRKVPQYLVLNWMDTDEWLMRDNPVQNKKIAMVGRINAVKNFPLALQVMKALPEDYTLDVAGANQDESLLWYLQNFLDQNNMLEYRVNFHGHVDDIKGFLQDKTYILSTSYREGCPMNVLEAMSMGLKPIVHNWIGSKDIFGEYVWDSIKEAKKQITEGSYDPDEYREFVKKNHGTGNANRLASIVTGLLQDNAEQDVPYISTM